MKWLIALLLLYVNAAAAQGIPTTAPRIGTKGQVLARLAQLEKDNQLTAEALAKEWAQRLCDAQERIDWRKEKFESQEQRATYCEDAAATEYELFLAWLKANPPQTLAKNDPQAKEKLGAWEREQLIYLWEEILREGWRALSGENRFGPGYEALLRSEGGPQSKDGRTTQRRGRWVWVPYKGWSMVY